MAPGSAASGSIAVTSVEQSRADEPSPLVGSRLLDEANLVIDLCTPHADALVAIDGLDTPVGPGSTIAAVAIVNRSRSGPHSCSSSAARCRRSSPGRRSWARSARGNCSTPPTGSMRGGSPEPSPRRLTASRVDAEEVQQ